MPLKQILFILILFSSSVIAQDDHGYSGGTGNPLYWKNRMPFPGYWQQDVQYTIKAEIDDMQDIISGSEQLVYRNNSPDTLEYVYFHLYQNAFQLGSYLDNLTHANDVQTRYSKWEKEKKGIVIEKMRSGDVDLKTETDNTVMKVNLTVPLFPGDSVMFDIEFKTYFGTGNVRRRMKLFTSWGHKHYNGAQWFPKISVYDRKFGWTADQHLNREFYGDFGSFDVALTFPNIYIVEATGILVNRNEVLPDSLRKALDVSNFKDKPFGFPPSLPVVPDDSKKTWKFHADNVHDFAFSADPTYRIGESETKSGVKCYAYVQESNASGWQNAAEFIARVIETYSEDIGAYEWPKMTACDARDGMEYPMITLAGGRDPDYRDLFAHEIAHQWFYGMVGNNETYRAMMDEGFSQFIQSECIRKLEGEWDHPGRDGNWYRKRFTDSVNVPFRLVHSRYLNEAIRGKDGFINTHSDQFGGALAHGGGYSMVYRKAAAMLYGLQYVLGDTLFKSAMKNYFNQWKFCHPYPEDFRNSVIRFAKTDLNWFFDQWMETDKRIDYSIRSVRKGKEVDDFIITFKRRERMQMPVDFTVHSNDGIAYNYHIPNRNFVKNTNATVLPKWFGWDKLNPEYQASIHVPSGIHRISIDTSLRLADINMLNNTRPIPITLRFNSFLNNPADWKHYVVKWRPDAWYNNYDGLKLGVQLSGNYFNYSRFFELGILLNTGLIQQNVPEFADINRNDPLSVSFTFRTPADKVVKNSGISLESRLLDGLQQFGGGITWNSTNDKSSASVSFSSGYRKGIRSIAYLLYPEEWEVGNYDNVINASISRHYKAAHYHGTVKLNLRSSTIGSNYDYSYLMFSVIDNYYFSRFVLRSRAFGQWGTGTNYAKESSLFLAGANGEELSKNKFTRSRAFVPEDWLGYGPSTNHFHQGGGLNLRAYAGYLVLHKAADGTQHVTYRGTTGWSFSEELEFSKLIPLKPRFTRNWLSLDVYLFGDAGSINFNQPGEKLKMIDVRADAGIGMTATIKKFFSLQTVKPFTIRCDFPLWVNRPPSDEGEFVKFRYVIGIGRSF